MKNDSIINIKNKWYKLEEQEGELRIANADKILGNHIDSKIISANKLSEEERESSSFITGLKLDEYKKLLNLEGQDKMMSIIDFCNSNPEIPNSVIFKILEKLKYVHTGSFNHNGEKLHWIAQQKPFTYFSIIPIYDSHSNNIVLKKDLMLSDEAIKTLKKECEYEYKNRTIKNKKQIENDIDNVIEKRITFANLIFNEDDIKNKRQLEEYENLLNLSGQNHMTPILEFYNKNSDVEAKIIMNKIKELNCMYLSPFRNEDDKKCIEGLPILPLFDYKLIPFYDENNVLDIEQDIVLSNELEKILQNVCDEAREKRTQH